MERSRRAVDGQGRVLFSCLRGVVYQDELCQSSGSGSSGGSGGDSGSGSGSASGSDSSLEGVYGYVLDPDGGEEE